MIVDVFATTLSKPFTGSACFRQRTSQTTIRISSTVPREIGRYITASAGLPFRRSWLVQRDVAEGEQKSHRRAG